MLGPHLLLLPAHKVLEFLIRQYDVCGWAMDVLLEVFLPYHECPIFPRLLRLLNVRYVATVIGGRLLVFARECGVSWLLA